MAEVSVSHQVLKELYHEIYQLHWSYLELEDGLQKLEEQKLLEGLLKKFLCVVPHNRKFFLPETFVVFKNTITQMKDFSVVKMLNGFESISQYANNLFTKPWRKEYRTIKMYSGFFIHEIKSNLIDPEELFVAMGYKKMPNQELVLDGEDAICPDQVMNMSRDAMTAYTECKIMNRIYSELTTTYKINCSWVDVFNYREQHTGGVTETIEAIKNLIQHHNMTTTITVPREKQLQGPCYTQQPLHLQSTTNGVIPQQKQTQCMTSMQQPNVMCGSEYLAGNHHHHPIPACAGSGQLQSSVLVANHHHHHYEQPSRELIGSNCDNNYYPVVPNGTLPTSVATGGLLPTNSVSRCGSHQQGMMATPAGLSPMSYSNALRMNHDQQSVYAPHSHHTTLCDYGPPMAQLSNPPGALPHSKSMDHYSYPTVLGDVMHRHGSLDHNHHLQQQQQAHHLQYEDHSHGGFNRSHGNVNGLVSGGGGNYYEPVTAAAAYNVSGTRYPLPYSISAQFGPPGVQPMQAMDGIETGQWTGNYYDHRHPPSSTTKMMMNHNQRCDNNNGMGDSYAVQQQQQQQQQQMMMMTNGGRTPNVGYAPVDCGHTIPPVPSQRAANGGVPRTQYYSQLMKTGDQMAAMSLGESSDEVDRFGGTNVAEVRKLRDSQQQTPRSSDFDSYEELFGESHNIAQQQQQQQHQREFPREGVPQRRSSSNKTRPPDKIQDGVGSYESWDYVYQSLDQEGRKGATTGESAKANGKVMTGPKDAPQAKARTMSKQDANKIQEHMSSLRAVKPPMAARDVEENGERRERRVAGGGLHQKSNSIGGSATAAAASKSLLVPNGNHQRQSSDSGLNGGHRMSSGRSNGQVAKGRSSAVESSFAVDSLPPPLVSSQDEWSCRFCTFLNDKSRRICEMCAKSKDFNVDSGSSATCV